MSRRKPVDEYAEPLGPEALDGFRTYEYSIRVDCPVCGARVGVVSKFEDRPELVDDRLAGHVHAGQQVGWPDAATFQQEVARIARRPKPSGHDTTEFNGRGGRVRAKKLPQVF